MLYISTTSYHILFLFFERLIPPPIFPMVILKDIAAISGEITILGGKQWWKECCQAKVGIIFNNDIEKLNIFQRFRLN